MAELTVKELRKELKESAEEVLDEQDLVSVDEVEDIVREVYEEMEEEGESEEKQHPSDHTEDEEVDNVSNYGVDDEDEDVEEKAGGEYTDDELRALVPDDLWESIKEYLAEPDGEEEVDGEVDGAPLMESLKADDDQYPVDLSDLREALPEDLFEEVEAALEEADDDLETGIDKIAPPHHLGHDHFPEAPDDTPWMLENLDRDQDGGS